MRIGIAGEVCSLPLKEIVREHLISKGYEVVDLGMVDEKSPLYFYQTGVAVAKAIQDKTIDRGILMCGTGNGVCIVANKFKGVYAGLAESATAAELHYVINRCNVLCMGKWIVGERAACDMADRWLSAQIGQGFSETRKKVQADGFARVQEIEKENFK